MTPTDSEKQKLLDQIDTTQNAEDTEIQIEKEHQPPANASKPTSSINMKYVSLLLLVFQNASLVLLTRYAKTRPGVQFVSTTAVVMAELFKIITCLIVTYFEMNRNFKAWLSHLHSYLIENWIDTLKVAVPAFVYMIQNNLLYVAIGNLPAATFQVSYQLKILTTAILSVIMLGKSINSRQWFSLLILFGGVSIVQLNNGKATENIDDSVSQSQIIGMTAVLVACCMSGFAGVYFEKILKGSKASLWTRNIQLGVFGFLTGLIGAYAKDGDKIAANGGFFYGYTNWVWAVIFMQAVGGLLVAVVIKYADNILKGFACSMSVIVSSIMAYFVFEFNINLMFCFGASLVCAAVYLYGLPNAKK